MEVQKRNVVVDTIPVVEEQIQITLTVKEATALMEVCGMVELGTERGRMIGYDLFRALENAGISRKLGEISGVLTFVG